MLRPTIPPAVFAEAVQLFWHTRAAQGVAQQARGVTDQGLRGAVTGGQQMDGFCAQIITLMTEAGVSREHICTTGTELPGYYRPSKQWDLVVVRDGSLVAAIEFKSQVGSFGNNFNNRTEEALGSAVDLWTAFREGALQAAPPPWLDYLFLLEDCARSRAPVGVVQPHFPVLPEFRDSSYAQRYELLCRKLVLERQYSATCLLLTDRAKADSVPNYTEPAEDLSSSRFLDQLLRHVVP